MYISHPHEPLLFPFLSPLVVKSYDGTVMSINYSRFTALPLHLSTGLLLRDCNVLFPPLLKISENRYMYSIIHEAAMVYWFRVQAVVFCLLVPFILMIVRLIELFQIVRADRIAQATSTELRAHADVCSICRMDMEVARKLRCKHMFHEECILEWLSIYYTCPICSAPVFDTGMPSLKTWLAGQFGVRLPGQHGQGRVGGGGGEGGDEGEGGGGGGVERLQQPPPVVNRQMPQQPFHQGNDLFAAVTRQFRHFIINRNNNVLYLFNPNKYGFYITTLTVAVLGLAAVVFCYNAHLNLYFGSTSIVSDDIGRVFVDFHLRNVSIIERGVVTHGEDGEEAAMAAERRVRVGVSLEACRVMYRTAAATDSCMDVRGFDPAGPFPPFSFSFLAARTFSTRRLNVWTYVERNFDAFKYYLWDVLLVVVRFHGFDWFDVFVFLAFHM